MIWQSELLLLVSLATLGYTDFMEDLAAFEYCKGKPTGLSNFVSTAGLAQFAICLTHGTKYCRVNCALEKYGLIDEEGRPKYDEMKKVYYQYSTLDKDTKDAMYKDIVKCIKNGSYVVRKNCEPARKAWYCIYNSWIKRCKLDLPPKNISMYSAESGIVFEGVDGVQLVANKIKI